MYLKVNNNMTETITAKLQEHFLYLKVKPISKQYYESKYIIKHSGAMIGNSVYRLWHAIKRNLEDATILENTETNEFFEVVEMSIDRN